MYFVYQFICCCCFTTITEYPVKITPNELVLQYGGPASAICTTTVAHDGMGWEASLGGISRTENVTILDIVTVYIFISEGQQHNLQCEILNVALVGKLQVNWYQDDKLLLTETFNESKAEPQNKTSTLTLDLKKEHNKANFTCETELLLGQQGQNPKVVSAPYTTNVQYAPSLSESDTREINTGENFTLNCSANGNPLPKLHWEYPVAANVNETTRERLSITEATSTNAGLYICSATNEVGSATKTVTLHIKGIIITHS
uniref:Ig-like domain-containing protein n=1 Tax=Periophthalmus magnuspinnatus TaxID=409849 RepID=A0A3B3Z9P0_9GOBI